MKAPKESARPVAKPRPKKPFSEEEKHLLVLTMNQMGGLMELCDTDDFRTMNPPLVSLTKRRAKRLKLLLAALIAEHEPPQQPADAGGTPPTKSP